MERRQKIFSSVKREHSNKSIKLLWNNVVKIGKHQEMGFPPDYIYEIERKTFEVIPSEIEILKPHLVLFLSGPNYDSVLADNFGIHNFKALPGCDARQLAKINLTNVPFAYRTYHPNYLFRNDIDDYFDTIIDEITNSLKG